MKKPDFRLDHTMIRVFDQDKTLDSLRRFEQLAEASGYFHHG